MGIRGIGDSDQSIDTSRTSAKILTYAEYSVELDQIKAPVWVFRDGRQGGQTAYLDEKVKERAARGSSGLRFTKSL